MFWKAQKRPKLIGVPTLLKFVPIVHCLLILQVIPAISLYIACSLTACAKYLQLAYSGAGNLLDQLTCKCPVDSMGKTYTLHVAYYAY